MNVKAVYPVTATAELTMANRNSGRILPTATFGNVFVTRKKSVIKAYQRKSNIK